MSYYLAKEIILKKITTIEDYFLANLLTENNIHLFLKYKKSKREKRYIFFKLANLHSLDVFSLTIILIYEDGRENTKRTHT